VAFGQLLMRQGLITEVQLQEARTELPEGSTHLQAFLRVLERRSWITPWQLDRVL
jgi:hypothetical protein